MHVRSGLESREENLAKEKAEAAVDGMQEEQNIIIPKRLVVLKVLRSGGGIHGTFIICATSGLRRYADMLIVTKQGPVRTEVIDELSDERPRVRGNQPALELWCDSAQSSDALTSKRRYLVLQYRTSHA